MIKALKRNQIDEARWNGVIAGSPYETLYPYTWYLDECADQWVGLVMGDYECVMPVAFRKKVGLKYSYQPFYCQQLGVFSEKPVDTEIVRIFLRKYRELFRMGDYAFNAGNLLGEEKGFEDKDSANYVLALDASADELVKRYNENCRRNVRKAYDAGLSVDEEVPIAEMLQLKNSSEKVPRTVQTLRHREKVFSFLLAQGKARIIGAREGGELLAAAVFAASAKRRIFLLSASSEAGLQKRAMFMVVDHFIRQHEEQSLKLDFEGSNIVSIARFFRGFGAKPEIYQRIAIQNSAIKILKKLTRV